MLNHHFFDHDGRGLPPHPQLIFRMFTEIKTRSSEGACFTHGWAEHFAFQRGSGSANFQDEAPAAAPKTAAEAGYALDLQRLGWGAGGGTGGSVALKGIHTANPNLGICPVVVLGRAILFVRQECLALIISCVRLFPPKSLATHVWQAEARALRRLTGNPQTLD